MQSNMTLSKHDEKKVDG